MKKDDLMTLTSATKDSIALAWRHVEIFESMTSSSSSSSSSSPPLFLPSSPSLSALTSPPPPPSSSSSSSTPSTSTRRSKLTGYQITYQAAGSTLVQRSRPIAPGTTSHVISNLHESTIYDVCLVAHFTVGQPPTSSSLSSPSSPSSSSPPLQSSSTSSPIPSTTSPSMPRVQHPTTGNATIVCLEASTVTESFAMMVGSTLGAFLALAIVVSMVYLAKRQRKHFKKFPDYRDDPRFDGRRSNAPHGLEEALLRMGDNVFLQVYKQKMPRLRSEGDEIEIEQPNISAEDLVVCREESKNFVLVSLDDAMKLVEGVDGVAFLEGDEEVICVDDVYDDEEEELDMQIEDQANPVIRSALDPKTIVENAYRVKL